MAGIPEVKSNEPLPKIKINSAVSTVRQLEKARIPEGQEVIIQTYFGERTVKVTSYKSGSHEGGEFHPKP